MTPKQPIATAFVALMKNVSPGKAVWFVGPKAISAAEMIKLLEAGNQDAVQRCRYVLSTIIDLLAERALNETPTAVSPALVEMARNIDGAPLHTFLAMEVEDYDLFLSASGPVSKIKLVEAFEGHTELSIEYIGAVLAFIEMFLKSKTGLSWG